MSLDDSANDREPSAYEATDTSTNGDITLGADGVRELNEVLEALNGVRCIHRDTQRDLRKIIGHLQGLYQGTNGVLSAPETVRITENVDLNILNNILKQSLSEAHSALRSIHWTPKELETIEGAISKLEGQLIQIDRLVIRRDGQINGNGKLTSRGTNLPIKTALTSPAFLSALNAYPPENGWLVAFADIRNMGVPAKNNNGELVDDFVRYIGDCAAQLAPRYGQVIRQGGDEFVFLLHNTDDAKEELKLFLAKVKTKQATYQEKLQENGDIDRAKKREIMRGLRREFQEKQASNASDNQYDNLKFIVFLKHKFGEIAEQIPQLDTYSFDEQVVRLLHAIANDENTLKNQPDPDVLGVDMGAYTLPNEKEFTAENIQQGLNVCARHLIKNSKRNGQGEVIFSDNAELIDQKQYALDEQQRGEIQRGKVRDDAQRDYNARMAEETRRRGLQATDTIDDIPGQILQIERRDPVSNALDRNTAGHENDTPGQWYVSTVKMRQFGAWNNNLGYEVGNACLQTLFSSLEGLGEDVEIFRGRGGSMIVKSQRNIQPDLNRLLPDVQSAVTEVAMDAQNKNPILANLVTLESLERNALALADEETLGVESIEPTFIKPGTITIEHHAYESQEEKTKNEIMGLAMAA